MRGVAGDGLPSCWRKKGNKKARRLRSPPRTLLYRVAGLFSSCASAALRAVFFVPALNLLVILVFFSHFPFSCVLDLLVCACVLRFFSSDADIAVAHQHAPPELAVAKADADEALRLRAAGRAQRRPPPMPRPTGSARWPTPKRTWPRWKSSPRRRKRPPKLRASRRPFRPRS